MALEALQFPATTIPQLHRPIPAGAGQGLTIRRKTHTIDPIRMALEAL